MKTRTHPLKLWAVEQGRDLGELAGELGISPSQLSHVLSYRRRPGGDLIAAVAKLTGGVVDARAWWSVPDSWHAGAGAHWREQRGVLELSAQDAAGLAGMTINTYKLIELGARKPTLMQVFAICRALGTLPSKALDSAGA